jgi:chromosomal replication initiator protein
VCTTRRNPLQDGFPAICGVPPAASGNAPRPARASVYTAARPEATTARGGAVSTASTIESGPQGRQFAVPEDPRHPDSTREPARLWETVRGDLRGEVSEVAFHIWLQPLEAAGLVGDTLYVRAPDHVRTWVEQRFAAQIRTAATVAGLRAVELVDAAWRLPAVALDRDRTSKRVASGLNPRYTFDQFVICDGNRLAHAAALAVAELPGQAYNPLFIHGRPGLGKTHLLHAIGNYTTAYGGGLSVRYATIEEFTSDFTTSIRRHDTSGFRERFRGVDVLLIDDIQFLAEKVRTEEEFFHTFNALFAAGSQLVLTSDRKPREIQAVEARLLERFEHGLVAELEPPDFEARMAILVKRARLDGLQGVTEDTLAEVARRVTASVRTLEGALIRVVAYASLQDEPPTPGLAQKVLERLYPSATGAAAGPCTVDQIQIAAAELFQVSRDAILARDRRPRVAFARQIAMYLARELTDETLPAIGRGFGGRNHTTVLHAHKRIAEDLGRDPATAEAVDALRAKLRETPVDRA